MNTVLLTWNSKKWGWGTLNGFEVARYFKIHQFRCRLKNGLVIYNAGE
jgi:hypothetical protein